MKNTFKLALLSAVIIGSSLSAAQASDGTISFTGSITDTTCTVKVNNVAGAAPSVTLPPVSATVLSAADKTAGDTQFTVGLSGCQTGGQAITSTGTPKAKVFFEPGATVTTTGTLKNTAASGATNVDLQLLTGGTPIVAGDASQLTPTGTTLEVTGDTLLPYVVRYHATGVATAGPVTSSVVYDVVYN